RVPRFRQGPALQGVRLSQLHSRPAAALSYSVPQSPGGRFTLIIVDDPDDADPPGSVRRVGTRQVWLSSSRGYNVVSWRTNEIVYSLISDLDENDVLQLVQAGELRYSCKSQARLIDRWRRRPYSFQSGPMPKRILLIDSDESFAQGLAAAAEANGFQASTATHSDQGVALARRENPDLIVVCVEAQPT